MADDEKYVVHGMRVKCSEGSMENYINTDTGHGVVYQGQPVLNANDHAKDVNLTHFGDCKSKLIFEEAKKQADEKYKAEEGDGFFAKIGKAVAKTVTKAVLDIKETFASNKCELETPLPWIFASRDHMIDGAPALTMESQCACKFGGIITIVPEEEAAADESNSEVIEVDENAVPLAATVGKSASDSAMTAALAVAAAGIAASAGVPGVAAGAGLAGAAKAGQSVGGKTDKDVNNSDINKNFSKMPISPQGIDMIANFELSEGTAKAWGIGEFDTQGKMIGIYPHYVFKKLNGVWVSDGGITLGHGYYVDKKLYEKDKAAKILIDKYAPGASFTPPYTPKNGISYKVGNSSYMPLEEETKIYENKLKNYVDAVNDFLETNELQLSQNQFDALVSFTYQYGAGWWKMDKVMPKFIRDGKGIYDPDEVRKVFTMHDTPDRRALEAEVFINGY